MKILITESQLKYILSELATNKRLWSEYNPLYKGHRHFITEGLTMTYNPGKVIGILNRRFDLPNKGINVQGIDFNKSQKLILPPESIRNHLYKKQRKIQPI